MKFFRNHWYDIGVLLAILVLVKIYAATILSQYDMIMWLSLVTLFFHQLEEYRIAGTFPGMVNSVMYNSNMPDRYPLNSNTAVYVNVFFGWVTYLLAAVIGSKAIWLGMATILVSAGNVVAHTIIFNAKGKTLYNAGLATCWLLFVPVIYFFFTTIYQEHLASVTDYIIGIPLGIAFNILGILKPIDWFADRNTSYIFEQRNLLPKDRIK